MMSDRSPNLSPGSGPTLCGHTRVLRGRGGDARDFRRALPAGEVERSRQLRLGLLARPDQYTYLRTKEIATSPRTTADLLGRLRDWGLEVLGCGTVTPPWFSYYIDGCVQEIHADVPHGPWAYVFSLTRWEERGFTGGETLMLRPEALDFWRGFDPKRALEAGDVFDVIPASFNQLTVFDARVPHGVRAIRGTQDPLDSRVVLHGWFEYPELTLSEALQSQKSRAALQLVLRHLGSRLQEIDSVTGLLTVRVEVDGDGGVREVRPLSNTLVSTGGNPGGSRGGRGRPRDRDGPAAHGREGGLGGTAIPVAVWQLIGPGRGALA